LFTTNVPVTFDPLTYAVLDDTISVAAALASDVKVPVTPVMRSASAESPTFTVTPTFMFAALMPDVVTARIVCAPVKYWLAAIV